MEKIAMKKAVVSGPAEEKEIRARSGGPCLILWILLFLASLAGIICAGFLIDGGAVLPGVPLLLAGIAGTCGSLVLCAGLRIVNPNEAAVLVLFGNYAGTIRRAGFYWVNPFCVTMNPCARLVRTQSADGQVVVSRGSRKISLKVLTLDNGKQTVNDELGNPVIIGTIVIWRVVDTARAVFGVDNYEKFLSIQCDSAIRNVARLYPYDVSDGSDETTLRGSSQEVAGRLKADLQERVGQAGLEVLEVRITHLSYAPEIAAAMLQRQQAQAIIAARQKIVEGAVGMVEMALQNLDAGGTVHLDDERRAAMVSNLLVVLCGNRDVQPIVNSGSIY